MSARAGSAGTAPPVRLAVLALAAAGVHLLGWYVPISVAHTVPLFEMRPLGDWKVASPLGIAGLYSAVLAALFGLYAAGYRLLARGEAMGAEERRRAAIVVYGGAALFVLVLLPLPRLLSKDVFDYMVHGRILALRHANPYEIPADAFPPDDFLRAMGWPMFTSMYGPGWVSASGLIAALSPESVPEALLFYKVIFGLLHLANGALLASLLKGEGRPSLPGAFLYLWNPLVVLQTAGHAHNDGFLMTWVLVGLLMLQRAGRGGGLADRALGTICITISALVKYVTLPILALAIASQAREVGGRRGARVAAILASIAVAIAVLGYLPYAAGMDVLHFLRPYQHGSYQGSALMILDMAVKKVWPASPAGKYPEKAADLMQATGAILTLGLAAWGAVLLWRTRRLEDVASNALRILLTYLLVAAALLRISYAVWIVPLAILAPPGRWRRAGILFSASILALEIYWVYALPRIGEPISLQRQQAVATVVALAVPLSYLLAGRLRQGSAGAREGSRGS